MLDIKEIRDNPDILNKVALKVKGEIDTEGFLSLDEKRRKLLYDIEQSRVSKINI